MDRRCQAMVSKLEILATINFTRLKLANLSGFLYFFTVWPTERYKEFI